MYYYQFCVGVTTMQFSQNSAKDWIQFSIIHFRFLNEHTPSDYTQNTIQLVLDCTYNPNTLCFPCCFSSAIPANTGTSAALGCSDWLIFIAFQGVFIEGRPFCFAGEQSRLCFGRRPLICCRGLLPGCFLFIPKDQEGSNSSSSFTAKKFGQGNSGCLLQKDFKTFLKETRFSRGSHVGSFSYFHNTRNYLPLILPCSSFTSLDSSIFLTSQFAISPLYATQHLNNFADSISSWQLTTIKISLELDHLEEVVPLHLLQSLSISLQVLYFIHQASSTCTLLQALQSLLDQLQILSHSILSLISEMVGGESRPRVVFGLIQRFA